MSETNERCPNCPRCGDGPRREAVLPGSNNPQRFLCGSYVVDVDGVEEFGQSSLCMNKERLSLRAALRERDEQLAAVRKERDELKDGYDRSPVSAKACPGCVYENGKFVRECGLHKRLCDERDRAAAATARADMEVGTLKETLQRYRRARGLAFGRVAYDPRDPKNHEMAAWAEVLALLAQPAQEAGDA